MSGRPLRDWLAGLWRWLASLDRWEPPVDDDLTAVARASGVLVETPPPGKPHPAELDQSSPVAVDDLGDLSVECAMAVFEAATVRAWCVAHSIRVHPTGALPPGAVAMWRADLRTNHHTP